MNILKFIFPTIIVVAALTVIGAVVNQLRPSKNTTHLVATTGYPLLGDTVTFKENTYACKSKEDLEKLSMHIAKKETALTEGMISDYRCPQMISMDWKILKIDSDAINHFVYLGDPEGKGFGVWTYIEFIQKIEINNHQGLTNTIGSVNTKNGIVNNDARYNALIKNRYPVRKIRKFQSLSTEEARQVIDRIDKEDNKIAKQAEDVFYSTFELDAENKVLEIIAVGNSILDSIDILKDKDLIGSDIPKSYITTRPFLVINRVVDLVSFFIIKNVYTIYDELNDVKVKVYLLWDDEYGKPIKHLISTFDFNRKIYTEINWSYLNPTELKRLVPNFSYTSWYNNQMNAKLPSNKNRNRSSFIMCTGVEEPYFGGKRWNIVIDRNSTQWLMSHNDVNINTMIDKVQKKDGSYIMGSSSYFSSDGINVHSVIGFFKNEPILLVHFNSATNQQISFVALQCNKTYEDLQ